MKNPPVRSTVAGNLSQFALTHQRALIQSSGDCVPRACRAAVDVCNRWRAAFIVRQGADVISIPH